MARRRNFLIGAGTAAAGFGLWGVGCGRGTPPAPPAGVPAPAAPVPVATRRRQGTIVGAGRYYKAECPTDPLFCMVLVDLDGDVTQENLRTFDMTFFGHGLAPSPIDPGRAVVFEKKGPGCCEVDLVSGAVTRPIATTPGRAFYGHGAFSKDGKLLYAAENDLATYEGLIAVRDGATFQDLGNFPTFGQNPHDCHLIDDGKTLAITNGGGRVGGDDLPCVTFVDVATRQLLEKLVFQTPYINAGHLAITKKRDVVAISAPRDGLPEKSRGGLTARTAGGSFATVSEPEPIVARMIGETLSVAVHEPSGIVGVTNPSGGLVTFWDLSSMSFVANLDLDMARGITRTLDDQHFVVSHGNGDVTLVATDGLKMVPGRGARGSKIGGSHLFTWDPPAA